MKFLDLETWNRKEHFEFFKDFEEPYFGLNFEVDVTKAYNKCKEEKISFFLYYHHLCSLAANKIAPFKYRIQDDKVVVYDKIHISTNIMREDTTFSFSFIEHSNSLDKFIANADAEIKRINESTGLGIGTNSRREDTIQYSTIPWINFNGLTHARNYKFNESVPKISFGKIVVKNSKRIMPIAVFVNHALMDGYHVGLFAEELQALLDLD